MTISLSCSDGGFVDIAELQDAVARLDARGRRGRLVAVHRQLDLVDHEGRERRGARVAEDREPDREDHRGDHEVGAGPAKIVIARCQIGFEPYSRGVSSGGFSSYGFMPAIFT